MPTTVRLERGSLYLSAALYERYFPGLAAVILLRQEDSLVIMPVAHAAGGGYLLKLVNTAGDRVVNAMDFFRSNGLDDNEMRDFDVAWSTELAGLQSIDAFKTAN